MRYRMDTPVDSITPPQCLADKGKIVEEPIIHSVSPDCRCFGVLLGKDGLPKTIFDRDRERIKGMAMDLIQGQPEDAICFIVKVEDPEADVQILGEAMAYAFQGTPYQDIPIMILHPGSSFAVAKLSALVDGKIPE